MNKPPSTLGWQQAIVPRPTKTRLNHNGLRIYGGEKCEKGWNLLRKANLANLKNAGGGAREILEKGYGGSVD